MTAAALVSGYSMAVENLRCASRGLWNGPALSPDLLADAASTVDGADPEALVTHTQLAVGDPNEISETQQCAEQVCDQLGGVADGAISENLGALSTDWSSHREAVQYVGELAADCAAAINAIAQDSGDVLLAMCEELQRMIAVLCAQLHTLDPANHAAAFRGCIDAASTLIDRAGTFILGVCNDRDEALGQCYDRLLGLGEPAAQQQSTEFVKPVVATEPIPPAPEPAPVAESDAAVDPAPVVEPEPVAPPPPPPVEQASEPAPSPTAECVAPPEPEPTAPVGGTSKSGGARKAGAW
ncbi:MAG: hypothetical protein Q4A92_06585 [Corynebacterium sp.]|nr:hypothetical protein [Corynebacterium sp.]